MKVVVRSAPEGVASRWQLVGGTLVVWVSDALDDVAKRRYIAQAKLESGRDRKRRTLVPLPLRRSGRRTSRDHTASIATIAVIAAAGVAAATVVPIMLSGHDGPPARPPAAVAPPSAVGQPEPLPDDELPPSTRPPRHEDPSPRPPTHPPTTGPAQSPDRAANKPPAGKPTKRHRRRVALPSHIPHVHVPPVVPPSVDAKPAPPAGARARCVHLQVGGLLYVQLGCGHLLGVGQP